MRTKVDHGGRDSRRTNAPHNGRRGPSHDVHIRREETASRLTLDSETASRRRTSYGRRREKTGLDHPATAGSEMRKLASRLRPLQGRLIRRAQRARRQRRLPTGATRRTAQLRRVLSRATTARAIRKTPTAGRASGHRPAQRPPHALIFYDAQGRLNVHIRPRWGRSRATLRSLSARSHHDRGNTATQLCDVRCLNTLTGGAETR
jgi:hypothetical protein